MILCISYLNAFCFSFCFLQVILGGGRRHFLPRKENDPKIQTDMGRREDGRNLIDEWLKDKKTRDLDYEYVFRKEDFDRVNPANTDYLLGMYRTTSTEL